MMAALIAEPQPCPILMWCRTVDIGAHHACWLLLQALFILPACWRLWPGRGQWLTRSS